MKGFNPHPARRPDATLPAPVPAFTSLGFNPHPARRPDATSDSPRYRQGHDVSILIRPECGCNKHGDIILSAWPLWFQSSSGQKAGCNTPDKRGNGHQGAVSILIRPEGRMQRLYLNFLSVLREPPDTALPICFHRPGHPLSPATIQLRTRTSRLEWLQHWVRVRPPAVPRSRSRRLFRTPPQFVPASGEACRTGCCPDSRP